MKTIFKQTFTNMRTQPLLTGLTIAGTALAICLIMIMMMTREVRIADYGNEPYRSRTLYVSHSMVTFQNNGGISFNGSLEGSYIHGIFLKMKTPEAVAVYSPFLASPEVSIPNGENMVANVKAVNAAFFHVFPLQFVEGQAFTEEECSSNVPIALLSRSLCRRLFHQEQDVKGKVFIIANREYRVAGVVEDVSPLLRTAYAEIWVPAHFMEKGEHPLDNAGLMPVYNGAVALLAKSQADFPKIRKEVEQLLNIYNQQHTESTLNFIEQPDTREVADNREFSNVVPDMQAVYRRYIIIIAILLIVPAINIASMTQSRLRQRKEEIGVRRTFGAKRSTILGQIFMETFIQTIAAGLLGLMFCIIFCFAASDYIFEKRYGEEEIASMSIDPSILFSPQIYGWALLFCFILNTMCSLIPAWRASRKNIVESLK